MRRKEEFKFPALFGSSEAQQFIDSCCEYPGHASNHCASKASAHLPPTPQSYLPALTQVDALRSPESSIPNLGESRAIRHHNEIYIRGLRFFSVAEAALALILEELVSGFKLTPGETCQVPIGAGRSVDFKVGGVLVEFHNLRFRREHGRPGDFRNHEQFLEFQRAKRQLPQHDARRKTLIIETSLQLKSNYYQRRRKHIDSHPTYQGVELIVATSWREFYKLVIVRFGDASRYTEKQFKKLLSKRIQGLIRAARC